MILRVLAFLVAAISPALAHAQEVMIRCDLVALTTVDGRQDAQQENVTRYYVLDDTTKTVQLDDGGVRQDQCHFNCQMSYTDALVSYTISATLRDRSIVIRDRIDRVAGKFSEVQEHRFHDGKFITLTLTGPCESMSAANRRF